MDENSKIRITHPLPIFKAVKRFHINLLCGPNTFGLIRTIEASFGIACFFGLLGRFEVVD
jgi:hypothetical protein